ncbi:predicted protein [Naegleria gruberi]|uniref:Predicted protein n=1 Tax=Naegleria gruberi TaxID=5762 RepID=D2VUY1_NAEGR|nr:uncharacterized protein NAEGRDRAFT_72825 [Naegleria gruberi]EFC39399.1 predicted protein [Naegleria gruberi]|eukprot:XP_002672143.1 predicted protein [Naegleria gruberi strain NEG-M]
MEIDKTQEISDCLQKAKSHLVKYGTSAVESSLRVQIEQFDNEDFVTFEVLKRVIEYLNNNTSDDKSSSKTYLHKLVKGSKIRLTKQTPTITKKDPKWLKLTEQLKKKMADEEYSKMVKNVVGRPRDEREAINSYKGQLGVGLDLVVTMATMFILFFTISQYIFEGENKTQNQMLFGLFGLIVGLLIDAILVIVRGEKYDIIGKQQLTHKNIATNAYGIETVPLEIRKKLAQARTQKKND